MIRNGPGKGSWRRAAALAGILLLAGPSVGPLPAEGTAPKWWEIRLAVAAKGTYAIRGGETPVSGEYAVKARYEGRLNPDGDDFLLILVKTETPEWSLRERTGLGEAGKVVEAPALPAPVLRLNYVLRDEDTVEIDLTVEGGTVPLGAPGTGVPLELPRSGHGPGGRPGYLGDVLDGSDRIVLPASDLGRRRSERVFAWTWSGTRLVAEGGRTCVTNQGYSAEVIVVLVGH